MEYRVGPSKISDNKLVNLKSKLMLIYTMKDQNYWRTNLSIKSKFGLIPTIMKTPVH